MVDYHARAIKAWETRARNTANRLAVQQGNDFAKPKLDGQPTTPDENPTGKFTEENREALHRAESEIRRNEFESAHVYNETGSRVMVVGGEQDHVVFSPEEAAQLSGKVLTHNHPASGCLSPEDVALSLKRGLREIRAITKDGTLYRFGREGGYGLAGFEYLFEKRGDGYLAIRNRSIDATRDRILRGEITVEEANANWISQHHAILSEFVQAHAKLGLYYKVTKGAHDA